MDNEKHYLPKVLRKRGCYQNGISHFYTAKRYDCLVGDQNDHQLKSVRYGWGTTNVGAGNFFVKSKDPSKGWSEPIYLKKIDSRA